MEVFEVRICNSPEIFCQRYGFAKDSQVGQLFHHTIFKLLEANKVVGNPGRGRSIRIATWLDNKAPGGETKFLVNEATADILFDFNCKIRDSVKNDKAEIEGIGRNFLGQQIRGDLFG